MQKVLTGMALLVKSLSGVIYIRDACMLMIMMIRRVSVRTDATTAMGWLKRHS